MKPRGKIGKTGKGLRKLNNIDKIYKREEVENLSKIIVRVLFGLILMKWLMVVFVRMRDEM